MNSVRLLELVRKAGVVIDGHDELVAIEELVALVERETIQSGSVSARMDDAELDALIARELDLNEAQIRLLGTAYDAGRAAGIEEAAKVCISEILDAPDEEVSADARDTAWNAACDNCAAIIRALAQPSGERTA